MSYDDNDNGLLMVIDGRAYTRFLFSRRTGDLKAIAGGDGRNWN
jgi:hypothetical protein